jgi:hypothetical protein
MLPHEIARTFRSGEVKEKEMKYLKMLGLAAVAATALMAFVGAGTAMAEKAVVCSTVTNPCTSKWAIGTVLDWSLKPGTSARLTDTSGNTLDTCTISTVKGRLTENPNGTGTATGENEKIDWGNCTVTTDTDKLGKLKIKGIPGTNNGTLYADAEIMVTISIFGTVCGYGVETGAHIGTVFGGVSPTFTANAVAKRLFGNFLCPETTRWNAEYVLTEPTGTPLYVVEK